MQMSSPVGVARFGIHPLDPVVFQFIDATLEVVALRRAALERGTYVDRTLWAVPGVYVLIGPPAHGGTADVRARPGLARGDLLDRVREHLRDQTLDWFVRCILVRDTRQGFNSAQAAYLEGELHNLARAAERVEHNYRRDRDESLQEWESDELDARYLPHIVGVLELIGVPLREIPADV
jgi:hypothetical protein